MRYFLMFFTLLLPGMIISQTSIDRLLNPINTVSRFIRIADSLQMDIDELCNYPIISPIKKPFRISSHYGMRMHPISKKLKLHKGIDIPKPKGTFVHATGNGIVIAKGYSSSYGNFIEIKHVGGLYSFYAHLDQAFVHVGDSVLIMDSIATVGKTGLATGYHLHYEVRK